MSLQDTIQNFLGRNDCNQSRIEDNSLEPNFSLLETQNQQEQPIIHEEDVNQSSRVYQQWYTENPERFELEVKAMRDLGFETGILRDGRVCFLGQVSSPEEYDVAVICDWLYPLTPPIVFVEGESEEIQLPRNDDGSVEIFSQCMNWEPYMAAVTVVNYLEEKLNLIRSIMNPES